MTATAQVLVRVASLRLAQSALRDQIGRIDDDERVEEAVRAIAEIDGLIADLDASVSIAGAVLEHVRKGGR